MQNVVTIESAYKKLLAEIQQNLEKTQQKITRQKIEMCHEIGRLVEEHLSKNRDETYGKNLILRLERDVKISSSALYKMHNFYQAYPKLPKDDPKLNWSHYRVLAGIQDKDERKYLEDLARENEWSGDVLQKKIAEQRKEKPKKNQSKKLAVSQKLKFSRGKLFAYRLARMEGSKEMFVDLGFNIFSATSEIGTVGDVVVSEKNDKNYSLKKIKIPSKEIHTYKAFLERVVDGDTIRVSLDLGFGIFHKEILRLAQINAPELETAAGKKSFSILKKLLKDVEFLIIKTNKTDIYGRYIADIFLPENQESDPQKVASEGRYLNQVLVDCFAATAL